MGFYKDKEMQNFIREYAGEIEAGNAAIFAGAGLSVGTGAVSWKELLREAASNIGIDVDKEYDLVSVAQYIYNQSNSRNKITRLIKNHIKTNGKVTENHKILASLPIKTFWTTNYDEYIEESLKSINKVCDAKKNVHDLSTEINDSEATVYKMHGDINQAHEAVLIKDDFEIYDKKNELFTLALKGDLISKTFLFIGFSFDDPNLETILSKVRIMLEGNIRTHFCFFKSINENDPEFENETDESLKKEKVEYAKNKQYLKIKDLERYGIKSILVENYSDITEILKKIKNRYKSKNIFISGSNSDPDLSEYKIQGRADEFIAKLSYRLHMEGYLITTGLGLYVGNQVVSGVLEGVEKTQTRNLDSAIKMRAFPQVVNQEVDSERVWSSYRERILEDCGSVIFLMGNKMTTNKEIVYADGIEKEFKIAHLQEKNLIPVGITGYQSKLLWEKMNDNLLEYYPHADEKFKSLFSTLISDEISEGDLINSIIEIININRGVQ